MFNPDDPQSVEKYSSAVTLSDMEVFIFPELMYALVLANIMSPCIWRWRNDPWFSGMQRLSPYRRILRTKQYLMDNFAFNLDLDTWGLTTKERELERFRDFIDPDVLARSNALFGYEGDKFYFDMDIRRHFGLDTYDGSVIPYWKTETVEAMEAFRYKPGYPTGAGECVSLAALYAAALFIVAGVPLEDIYMMATPLHSQNFIDINDGLLTNNRRIVTKNMFFNGTEISAKARRALENEQVTIVAHCSGYIHSIYDRATMPAGIFRKFSNRLRQYLKTDITFEVLANFLRQNKKLQRCFQLSHTCCGKPRFIEAEKVFHYEHSSTVRIGDSSRAKLLHDIDEDEFYPSPLPGRLLLDEIETFFRAGSFSLDSEEARAQLRQHLSCSCFNAEEVVADLLRFCTLEPRLPLEQKTWAPGPCVRIAPDSTRDEVIAMLDAERSRSPVADLAFQAWRDMQRSHWKPFVKAALERNPVSVAALEGLDLADAAERLRRMENVSIYDGTRMSQPDEVWNFQRGDGLEKALCLMNLARHRYPQDSARLTVDKRSVCVGVRGRDYRFETDRQIPPPGDDDFAG
ncbi:MAG: hypothetical protein FJ119_11375 [Deltaproteobacteria bacterium]|nr:hypothetical protein [Deltaproteobacteria bacterium]